MLQASAPGLWGGADPKKGNPDFATCRLGACHTHNALQQQLERGKSASKKGGEDDDIFKC